MSDLYRSALSARISKLPMLPPEPDEEDEESEAADSLGSLPPPVAGIGPTTMPGTRAYASAQRKRAPNPELTPLSASAYFAQATQIAVPDSGLDVRAYYTPPRVREGGGTRDGDSVPPRRGPVRTYVRACGGGR
ncbi:hypothetical protein EVJ58_g6449 [Rhodofomes roseus]|uniref:Uncharacterized protein n=1 Tax=Rhodofomes roseus TaxID=34475 RepID=A0A4Y9Y9I3_9APHY|nr:hypothetical protein EVJ58_g6449 [Rhodofomes roseus]